MKLSQIKGRTWVAEGEALIPFYTLDDGGCILLDSGLAREREALESALLSAGLTPVGILCSHAHEDHGANNRYFQEKYRIPVALTLAEAGMCCSLLNLKCYYLNLSTATVEHGSSCMIHTPDVLIPPTDGPFDFAGARFQILQTPGHSSGHISLITPDNVCYTADALLSEEFLTAKLPYNLSQQMALDSRERLLDLNCHLYIMAHRGVCTQAQLPKLVADNQALIAQRAEEIFSLISQPMTISQINEAVCRQYQLFTKKPHRALRFERNIRFFLEHLIDQGRLDMVCHQGVTQFCRPIRHQGI